MPGHRRKMTVITGRSGLTLDAAGRRRPYQKRALHSAAWQCLRDMGRTCRLASFGPWLAIGHASARFSLQTSGRRRSCGAEAIRYRRDGPSEIPA